LAARLDVAITTNRGFYIVFDKPSDLFATRFLGALRVLFKSHPEACAQYVGGVKIGRASVDIKSLVETGDSKAVWERTKIAAVGPRVFPLNNRNWNSRRYAA
jgi:hypothetical protein